MRRAWLATLGVAIAIGGCKTERGSGFENPRAADPWGGGGAGGGDADAGGGGFAGFGGGGDGGLQQIIKNVIENLKKPGPYEAPDHGAAYKADDKHFAVVELSGAVVEREAYSFSLFGGAMKGTELRALIDRFETLGKDDKLAGLVVRVDGIGVSTPDAIELRRALHAFRDKGKRLACFTDGVGGTTYLVMAACDRLAIAPLGDLELAGPSAMPVHIKPLLDSLNIKADFLHVGQYKGAAEPLTLDAPSPQMVEVINQILDRNYQTTIDIVAAERKIPPDQVKVVIDTAIFDSDRAKAANLVDEVTTWEGFRDEVTQGAWTALDLDKSDDGGDLGGMVKAMQFIGMAPVPRPAGPHVAVVYALGNIVGGDGDGLLGARAEIASGTLVPALQMLAADDNVKAVVLRIDSGGGSAQASELIWRAVAELKAKKPVVVSMSDVAASGGYYIAAGATKIYALADTLTGSIGVIGGKLAIGGGLDKFGIKTYPMGKGKRATMFTSLGLWTADERAAIQQQMEAVYEVFKGRVATGRGKTPDQIQPIAQGHVWTGARAKELGLVDEIGGLDDAIAEAQKLAKVSATAELEVYPPAPTLRDLIHGFGGVQASAGLTSQLDAVLAGLPVALAAHVRGMVAALATFQYEPIQARAFMPLLTR